MATKGTAAALIEVAQKEIGTIEGPKDNETKYGAFTKVNFLPWCGSFVMWCANQAGVKVPNCVSTVAGATAFQKMGSWTNAKDATPLPGDIAFFDFPGDNVSRISHVGIVVSNNNDGTVTCIEGNTAGNPKGDQRNGGEVAVKVRAFLPNKKKTMVSIVGFGRPNYKGNEVTAKLPAPEAPAFPGTIKPGDKSEGVRVIQGALALQADGIYGPLTKAAVIKFQDNHDNLDSNGIIGPKTWAEITKSL